MLYITTHPDNSETYKMRALAGLASMRDLTAEVAAEMLAGPCNVWRRESPDGAYELERVAAVYVTAGRRGPSYRRMSQGRLFPITADVAERSFAHGAIVFRKQAGVDVWAPEAVAVVDGQ